MSNVAICRAPAPADVIRVRHARLRCEAVVLLTGRAEVWEAERADISATGARVTRPAGWHGGPSDAWVLEVLVGGGVDIHMLAEIVRVDDTHIAFAFARIAEDSKQALWRLLGGYADRTEP